MNKKTKFIYSFIAFLTTFFVVLAGFLYYKTKLITEEYKIEHEDTNDQKQDSDQEVLVTEMVAVSSGDGYVIDVKYPSFSGLDKEVEDNINQKIEAVVTEKIDNFIENNLSYEGGTVIGEENSSLYISYEEPYMNSDVISLLLSFSGFEAGATHEYNYFESYNFDRSSGRTIELKDFFRPGSLYLLEVSKVLESELDKYFRELDSSYDKNGIKPYDYNFEIFTLTSDGFEFFFNPYQIGSYSLGVVRIVVPFDKFDGLNSLI
ncbi:DUF3298 domain-containing protein [Candidatus Nomurabacteria bacterium]|nr:DUF3298 domain-containing protein [Candidatus Nomurabacteria bacterium]